MKKNLVVIIYLIVNLTLLAKTIYYPNIDNLGEKSFGFQLLKLVLSKIDEEYEVILHPKEMNSGRALNELEKGNLSVVDSCIGEDIESRFSPIYIPIDMGLTGWRIFIIHKDSRESFSKIKTLDELCSKISGQGIGWTDNKILNEAGIKVETATKVELLIRMVERKRFDYFPLGVNEAHGFLKEFGNGVQELEIEENLVLVYPFARLYYVNKSDKQLHDDIINGLELAYSDGSYKKFIDNHPFFKEGFEKSDLKNRTIIKIDNPFMSEQMNKIDPKWWFRLEN